MPKQKRWTFWKILWKDRKSVYERHSDSTLKWPVNQFERLAKRLGFTVLKADTTLIGGYFVDPETGDCLVCLPHHMDPAKIY